MYSKIGSSESFYKDGYTDVRGLFDFVSLNNDKLSRVSKFAILVIADDHGAVIVEAQPPKF